MERKELPIGFGMALAEDERAMKQFESLPEGQKNAIVQRSRNVRSQEEMQRLVSSLVQK